MCKNYKIYLIFIILIILGFVFYINKIFIKDYFLNYNTINLPEEQSFNDLLPPSLDLENFDADIENNDTETIHEPFLQDDNQSSPNLREQEIKQDINLKIPFTIQSPDQKWDEDYKEGCEEASILMIYSFLKNKEVTINSAMNDIGEMISWQKDNLGGHYDLSATTTAYLANKFYGLQTQIIELKSIENIKTILSTGNPVILPTLGRELKNPNFKSPGPLYHMLVAKGYTKDGKIITNDPGTRKGKDYIYNPDILWNAIGDWDYNLNLPNPNIKIGIILR